MRCSRSPTRIRSPPRSQTTFRVDGTVPAAAELLSSDALRATTGLSLDPATSRGTVTAQVTVNALVGKDVPKNTATYTVSADLTNFSADKLLIGQKVEAAVLHVNATRDGYEAKGDVKINGTPANLDFRQATGEPDGDLRLQLSLDEAARARLGLDLGASRRRHHSARHHRPRRRRRARRTPQRRRRSHAGKDRQPAARLDQARRQARARHLYDGQDREIDALRRSHHRGLRRQREGLGRVRSRQGYRRREFPGVRLCRRRQGHAQGRPRQRRHAARRLARRHFRRQQFRQGRARRRRHRTRQSASRPISISTSSSAP